MISRRRRVLSLFLVTALAFGAGYSRAGSLKLLKESTYAIDGARYFDRLSAAFLGDDSLALICEDGLLIKPDSSRPWQKVMDPRDRDKPIPYTLCDGKQDLMQLEIPEGIWRISERGSEKTLVLEGYCGRMYSLETDGSSSYLKYWGNRDGPGQFEAVNIHGDLILSGICRFAGEKAVKLRRTDGTDYREIFEYPQSLAQRFDSVGWTTSNVFGHPALNPHDSTIWLAISAYDYIYMVDMNGTLQDSLHITDGDYRLPPTIKSRIRTAAVVDEWYSHWTSITSFSFVSPDYFIMQYHKGFYHEYDEGKLDLYGTAVWNCDGQLLPTHVDSTWQLAGVEPDGLLIFGHYEVEQGSCRAILDVVRLEP